MREMNEVVAERRNASLGDEIVGRINELGAISETPEHLQSVQTSGSNNCASSPAFWPFLLGRYPCWKAETQPRSRPPADVPQPAVWNITPNE